jgi:hypothetical protein
LFREAGASGGNCESERNERRDRPPQRPVAKPARLRGEGRLPKRRFFVIVVGEALPLSRSAVPTVGVAAVSAVTVPIQPNDHAVRFEIGMLVARFLFVLVGDDRVMPDMESPKKKIEG